MERFDLFATPVFAFRPNDVADLNRELSKLLIAEFESSSGVRRSNIAGWHSTPDLSLREEPCYQRLMRIVVDHVHEAIGQTARARGVALERGLRFAVHAWAMVMRDGDYTVIHDHAQAHWSVVYYVDRGDPAPSARPDSGRLTLQDPRGALSNVPGLDLFPSQFSINPSDGLLVVFPGWLQHFVHPYRGTRPRISVSCNVRVEA